VVKGLRYEKTKKKLKKKKDEKDIDWFLNSNFKNKINYQ
jgi:hypothetical protein